MAQRIAEQRLTYKKLAKLVGVSVSAVYRWVHGVHEPRHYQRYALAEALDVAIDDLDWYFLPDDQPAAVPALNVGTTLPDVAGSVSDVDRREMLTALGGTFAAGAVFNFTGLFDGPHDVSPDLAGYFFDQLAQHNKANQQIGSRPVLPTVVAQRLRARRTGLPLRRRYR